jgi:hypothetical protein
VDIGFQALISSCCRSWRTIEAVAQAKKLTAVYY